LTAIRQKLLEVFEVEYRDHLEAIRTILSTAGTGAPAASAFTEATRRAHSLKGAARAVGLADVEQLAHGMESLFLKIKAGEIAFDTDAGRQVADALDEIEDRAAAPQSGPASPEAQDGEERDPDDPSPARQASVRIDADSLGDLFTSANELTGDLLRQRASAVEARAISAQAAQAEASWARLQMRLGAILRDAGKARMPELPGGEDLSAQLRGLLRRTRAVAEGQERSTALLSNNLRRLDTRVKATGMVSAESVFGGFRKMVRDLAGTEGKAVAAIVEGLDCEADRLVLQRIKDPVMHLLRNAVSHGIEPPHERRGAGKPEEGRIHLRLSAERGRLSITVEDDGRGVDLAAVAEQAAAQGLLPRAEAENASPDTLWRLLSEAGFSTARSVTTLSGRGVGLSIVREALAELDGTIALRVGKGTGTRIELSVPVNLLARRLLLVTFRDRMFGIPSDALIKVLRVDLDAVLSTGGGQAIKFNGGTVPLRSIATLLDLADAEVATDSGSVCVAVLHGSSSPSGLVVEGFAGVGDYTVRRLDVATGAAWQWSGVVTTPDGRPCLVFSTAALTRPESARVTPITFRQTGQTEDQAPSVLVVDDSITTRTLEKSILEAQGYRVRLSVDGMDAMAQLRAEPVDVVVSDIEMPRLDGFDLLRAMKSDERLAEIPVILVTSREDPADRERGLRLGADAYVVKQRFDQVELLKTIRQVI
jgi:two-component system chemotaxis sensor kinase CheA